jgi:hypothetical protein
MNMDLKENVKQYNILNGCIKVYFGKNMRKVKLIMHIISAKPALEYDSETWVMKEDKGE